MSLPDQYNEWATDGTNVVEPNPTRKAEGWLPDVGVPAQVWNWFGRKTYDWVRHLFEDQIADFIEAAGYTKPEPGDVGAPVLKDAVAAYIRDNKPLNVISPSTITADQDNYTPTGWSTATVVRIARQSAGPGVININGFGPATVRVKILANITSTGSALIGLKHNAAGQTAGNEISGAHGDFYLSNGDVAIIWYDAVAAKWKPLTHRILRSLDVEAIADLVAGGDVLYALPRTRTFFVNLEQGTSLESDWTFDVGQQKWTSQGALKYRTFPLNQDLHPTCTIVRVRAAVSLNGAAGTALRVSLQKRTLNVASSSSPAVTEEAAETRTATGAAILDTDNTAPLNEAVDKLTESWSVRVQSSDNGSGDEIRWIAVTVEETGPYA